MPADTPMVLVPRRPTPAMLEAMARYLQSLPGRTPYDRLDPGTRAGVVGAALFAWEAALSATSTAEQVAPSPGEGDARLCPCGQPALATASICSDCADACLASGEGDAPVALSASDRACYEYPGVDEQPLRAAFVAGAVFCASAHPTPATPEGLRAYERLRDAVQEFLSDWRKGDFKLSRLAALDAEAMETALAALQPRGDD